MEPPRHGATTRAQRYHTQAARHRSVGVHQRGVTYQDGQPACPICLDDLVAPQMLGCGHVYCAKCIATHASVQRAANRPVNCPCCLRPVAPTELPTEVHVEAAETAASSSTVEAPALSEREQRAFKRAAARLDLRLCPSCNAFRSACSRFTFSCAKLRSKRFSPSAIFPTGANSS